MSETKIRLGILYNYTSGPWGGVNSFFRNFNRYAQADPMVDVTSKISEADFILTVGHYSGPGAVMEKWQLTNISQGLSHNNVLGRIIGRGKKKLTFRLDGLRRIYAPEASQVDEPLIKNLPLADSVVFQSNYSRNCFYDQGLKCPQYQNIILNGTESKLFFPDLNIKMDLKKICIISNSWSTNHNKGFNIIAQFSKMHNVSVLHIGNWPQDIPLEKVQLLGVMEEKKIGTILRKGHFLLFPSENEACSNVVVEALASGLPVLYHNSGGTPELCQNNKFGLTLPKNIQDLDVINNFLDEAMDLHATIRAQILERIGFFNFQKCYEEYIEHFKGLI